VIVGSIEQWNSTGVTSVVPAIRGRRLARPRVAPTSARGVSHDRREETREAKSRWFQSLTLETW
jgi:hypothetical protein